ncbi:hypothetical protein BHM03_00031891 [Ensete ventricosum]|nr:hypothetical protein BHM03_00031891 [Ensete ventricosum]
MAAVSLSFKRSDSIAEGMPEALKESRYQMKKCFARYVSKGKRVMKNPQLMEELEKSIDDKAEKAKVMEGFLGYIILRPHPGVWEYVKVNSVDLSVDGVTPRDYLKYKETIYDEKWAKDEHALEVDLAALEPSTPLLTLPSSIGKGAQFISRFISAKLDARSESMKPLLDYLLALDHGGQVRRAGYS